MTAVLSTPTGEFLGTFSSGSEEWLAARADALGGSEVAAVLGLSPYESRFALWHRKAGRAGPQTENEEMEWGKRLEPAVCDKFADTHPEYTVGFAGTYRHTGRPWQIANPDRLLWSPDPDPVAPPLALLEAKTSPFGDGWGESGGDEIPVYYRCQVLWYCDTLGLTTAHVAVLIGGHDYREYTLHADPDEAQLLRTAATEFLASIAQNQRPDIDAHSATYQVIREMHPDIDPVDVELDQSLARAYCLTRQVLALAKADAQEAASYVADRLGNARRARYLNHTIATRQARGEGTPYLVCGRDLPDFDDQEPTP